MVNPSEWIAAAAFCISLAALLSNLLLIWLKWPRIVVDIAVRRSDVASNDTNHTNSDARSGEAFVLTVTNNGSEPVTVTSVGLTQHERDAHRLDYLRTWRAGANDRLPVVHSAPDTLIMPLRLDAHACHVFEYSPQTLTGVPRGVPYHGYAVRYQAFRWRPNHPMIRETRSKQTVTRRHQH